ncbi:MAG: PPC domain-containing protein [Pirellulales bacterium]|nr:PPC domain-containing protein [Pirellulales bacterium]
MAQAYRPEVTVSTPRGLQRGTTQKVVLGGTRLADARQLLIDRPGINVKSLKPIDNGKVELELEVPADTAPGLYPMRLATKTGLSNVIMFSVGAMPQVDEVEPNSEFGKPQQISNNVTIEGVVAREDEDYYAVTLKKGQPLTAELEGVRIKKGRSNPFFDPYIAILDSQRFELATSDDAPLLQQDCVCSIRAPEDGTYLIVVRDSSFGGNNDRYRLHVGSYPRPIAVVPAGGAPGEVLDMTFIDLHGDAWIEKVQLPSEPAEAFPLLAKNEAGISPSPNFIRVQAMQNVIEREPNNSFKESTPGPLPAAFCGIVGEPGDLDFFSFEAKKNQTVQIRVYARKVLRSALDSVLNVYNDKGGRVGGNDDSGGPDSYLEYKIPADGRYHIAVNDHLRGGGPGYASRIEAKLAEPQLTLSLPDRRRYEATQINVPQGNRAAVMINASRQRFGGAIDISGLNLPEGVTVTPIQMPANRTTVPLLLSAAPEAKLDARLVNFVGKVVDNPNIPSRFTQRHQLLIGQNNSVVYDYHADRGTVAVIDKLPCTIEVVQPQVPIVRNGAAHLTIRAHRDEGFDGDIPVRLLYNPPGIGSSGSIRITKGTNEAKIPITANGSAAIGTWPVIAYASVGGNEIASEPIMLEISDKIFNFGFPKTSSELGGQADILVDVEIAKEFEGTCQVELVGLPAGVVCENSKMEVKSDTEQVVFPVKIADKARVGQHKTLVARATITSPKGVIQQTQGTGTLQIDKPIPAPVAKPAPKPAAPKPVAKAPPAPVKKKPLSRLEQLRLMRKQAREQGTNP